MDGREKMLAVVYIITLLVVVTTLFELWGLAIIFFLVMIITLLQKIYIDENVVAMKKSREKMIDLITENLNDISKKLEKVAYEIKKKNFHTENSISKVEAKINKIEKEWGIDLDKKYRDIVRKVVDNENKINEVRRTLGIAYSDIDDRLKRFEGG